MFSFLKLKVFSNFSTRLDSARLAFNVSNHSLFQLGLYDLSSKCAELPICFALYCSRYMYVCYIVLSVHGAVLHSYVLTLKSGLGWLSRKRREETRNFSCTTQDTSPETIQWLSSRREHRKLENNLWKNKTSQLANTFKNWVMQWIT